MNAARVLWAFLRRDALRHASYRLSFFLSLGQLLVMTLIFFYIARLMGPQALPALSPYGGDYLAFIVLGLGVNRLMSACLSGLGNALRAEQIDGTLEVMWATAAPIAGIAAGLVVWEILWAAGEIAVYLFVGAWLFRVPLGACNIPATLALLALTLASLSPLGILAACGVLWVKEFDPMGWVLSGLTRVVAGVYFPVALLPSWAQILAAALPMTHALEALRQAVLNGASLASLSFQCQALALFALVCWPLALLSWQATLRRLQRAGALNFR